MMLMLHMNDFRPALKRMQTTDAVEDYLRVYVKQMSFMFRLGTHAQAISLYLSKYSKIRNTSGPRHLS